MADHVPNPFDTAIGTVLTFRCPAPREGGPAPRRYGLLKVIGRTDQLLVVAALEPLGTAPLTLADAEGAPILRQRRFSFGGRPAVLGADRGWSVGPGEIGELTGLGVLALSAEELAMARKYEQRSTGISFAPLPALPQAVEGEWRWQHDRAAFEAEVAGDQERRRLEQEASRRRLDDRMAGLTWGKLLTETPFENWTPSPPYPDVAFRDAAVERVHATIRELQACGPKPRRADARRILRALVRWFADAGDRAGDVLDTEEREDIIGVVAELAILARQRPLVQEAETWW